jgi:hypothetical protein
MWVADQMLKSNNEDQRFSSRIFHNNREESGLLVLLDGALGTSVAHELNGLPQKTEKREEIFVLIK